VIGNEFPSQPHYPSEENMPTSKKKATKAKASSKKTPAKRPLSAKVKLDFPLDANKIAAIKRCLAKGSLKVTVTRVDLLRGRLRDAYIYD